VTTPGTLRDKLRPADAERLLGCREQLVSSVARWLGSRAEAEDVLHDAYVKALTTRSAVRDDERVLPWFQRIVRNTALDRVRKRQADRRSRSRWAREAKMLRAPAPEFVTDAVCQCVSGVLSQLRPTYAQVIRRIDLDEAPIPSAADEMGTTANNLRVRLHRARGALRARLLIVCGMCAQHGCVDCGCHRGRQP
jgi:RNA polymerase sigma factor (sigma-70 family)